MGKIHDAPVGDVCAGLKETKGLNTSNRRVLPIPESNDGGGSERLQETVSSTIARNDPTTIHR